MGKKFLDDVFQGDLHYQMTDSFNALDGSFWDGCSELPSLVVINMSYFFSNVTAQFTERLAIQISEVMKKYPLNKYVFFIQHSEYDKNLTSSEAFGAYYYLRDGLNIVVNGGGFDHRTRCNLLTTRAWITPSYRWHLYGARLLFKDI